MDKPLLLVVEDDAAVRKLITMTLELQGYAFAAAETGKRALELAVQEQPDILLLDLGLPDLDGRDIILRLREWSDMPILVISARSDDKDKIAVYVTCATIDLKDNQEETNQMLQSLRWDG